MNQAIVNKPIQRDANETRDYPADRVALFNQCLVGVPLGLLLIAVDYNITHRCSLSTALVGATLGSFFSFLCVWLSAVCLSSWLTVQVGVHGICGPDFWGRKRTIAWTEVRRANKISLGPFVYMRVSDEKTTIWVPELAGQRLFERHVQDIVGADHLLTPVLGCAGQK